MFEEGEREANHKSSGGREAEDNERQVYRMVAALKAKGDSAVVHGLRGRNSNCRISAEQEQEAVKILRQDVYRGFGPTLASEYLASKHAIVVSKETVRQWMVRAGLRAVRRERIEQVHV